MNTYNKKFDTAYANFEYDTAYLSKEAKNVEIVEGLGLDPDGPDTQFDVPYVYCGAHCGIHGTGWCTVSIAQKRPLRATDSLNAEHEARKLLPSAAFHYTRPLDTSGKLFDDNYYYVVFDDFQCDTSDLGNLAKNRKVVEKLGLDNDGPDTQFGVPFVYCGAHRRTHSAGWCTVRIAAKRPLRSKTEMEADKEARALFPEEAFYHPA